MKIYKIRISSENGIQTIVDSPPEQLLYKNLYEPYPFKIIDSIRLDLDKGCNITDVLNNGNLNYKGFAIKNKYRDIFTKFNLLDVQFVEIIDDKIIDYSFMFFNSDLTMKLNYDKCNFILIEEFLGDTEVLNDNLTQERNSLIKLANEIAGSDKLIIPKNGYHFSSNFNVYEYDLFRIGQFNDEFYISDRLKERLNLEGISGINFIEDKLFNPALRSVQ